MRSWREAPEPDRGDLRPARGRRLHRDYRLRLSDVQSGLQRPSYPSSQGLTLPSWTASYRANSQGALRAEASGHKPASAVPHLADSLVPRRLSPRAERSANMTLNTRSSQIAFATKSGPRCPLPAAMSHLPHGIARAEPARAAQFIVNAEPILSVDPPSAGERTFYRSRPTATTARAASARSAARAMSQVFDCEWIHRWVILMTMSQSKSTARASAVGRKVEAKAPHARRAAARQDQSTGKRAAVPSRSAEATAGSLAAKKGRTVAATTKKDNPIARVTRSGSSRRVASAAKTAAKATRTRRKALAAVPSRVTQDSVTPAAASPNTMASVSPAASSDPAAEPRPAVNRTAAAARPLPPPPPAPVPRPRFRLGTFEDLLAPFPSQVQTLCIALRGLISRVVPGARETIITGLQMALFEQDGPIGLLSPQRDHARLYFVRGKELKDQSKLLQGGSGALPFVKLWHLDTLQVPALRSLILEAVELNRRAPEPNLSALLFGHLKA